MPALIPIVAAVISAGGAAYAANKQASAAKKAGGTESGFDYPSDYPETDWARGNWMDTLKKWQNEPGYGAISPNWGDIWENAKGKITQYYGGSATSPGVADKIRASLARGNRSEDPAAQDLMARMNVEQGSELANQATQQGIQQTNLEEQGRQSWLNSMMGLSNLKRGAVPYTQQVGGADQSIWPGVASAVGSGLNSYAQYRSNQQWLDQLAKMGQINSTGSSGGQTTLYNPTYGSARA